MAAYQLFANLASIDRLGEAVSYQGMGILVVFSCLSFLAIILAIAGLIAQKATARKMLAQSKAAAPAAAPATAPAPVPAGQGSPASIAALAASIYATAQQSLTPELVAVIAAAVHMEFGKDHRIVSIAPVSGNYARSGRSEIFASHRF